VCHSPQSIESASALTDSIDAVSAEHLEVGWEQLRCGEGPALAAGVAGPGHDTRVSLLWVQPSHPGPWSRPGPG
jgi:hypothetical protein